MIDSSTIPAKKGGDKIGFDGNKKIKGTKINITVNQDNIIISNGIMSGNRNDVIGFEETLEKISIKSGKVGRPRKKSKELYADKGYDTKKIRQYLRNRDTSSNIAINKRNRKKPKKGRPFKLNKDYFSVRGGIERVFGWLKMRFRKINVRYEIKASNFKAFLDFAIFFSNFKILRF